MNLAGDTIFGEMRRDKQAGSTRRSFHDSTPYPPTTARRGHTHPDLLCVAVGVALRAKFCRSSRDAVEPSLIYAFGLQGLSNPLGVVVKQ